MSHVARTWLQRLSRPLPGGVRPPRAASRALRSRRPELERLENRTVLSVTIANGQGYAGLDFNQSGGYVPPDTNGAAGPTNYVETVNQTVALYSPKATGASAITSSLSTFFFTTGGLARADGGSGQSDPIVAYNDQIGRFIVGDQDVNFNTHVSTFDIAVSKTSSPTTLGTGDWNFYRINTTESGFDADYPGNFGYNHDAFVFTLNMFGLIGGGQVQVVSVSNADLANNVAPHVFQNDINDFSLRPTVMHDSVAGDPMWLVTEHGDNQSIDVIKMTGVLSNSATIAYTNLAVTPYSSAVYPLNPNGTVITTNMDSRIQKAAEWGNLLVASHSVAVGATDVAQWYAVDVSGAAPTLKDQGRVSAGNKTYITYPSVNINASGQIGMTYMKSGKDTSTDYLSMYVTGRNPSDPAGTMQASVVVPAGTGQMNYKDFSTGGRAGDLSGINVDPSDGSFWAANEFANTEAKANWGTAIANFTISNPLPSTDMAVTVAGPASVDVSTGPATATYTITVTNNGPNAAQGVVLTDLLPAGSSYVSSSQPSGSDAFATSQSGGSVTEAATANIASGSSDTFSVVVSVPSSQANGSTITDTASVSASNPDPTTSNNTATASTMVVNTNSSADLSVKVTGPASANEGGNVTYTITVTNGGPNPASNVTLTDTLAPILNYKSATASQGTFGASGGVVTFSIGTLAANGTFTATVTARAIEDGSTSDNALVSSSSPDPNTANNTASATTSIAEPAISVSAAINTTSRSLTNFQVATFTHASGVEPVNAFTATINWGDGTPATTGTITLSGTTYKVTGSHTYSSGRSHTVKTTVTETGNSPVTEGGGKIDINPGTLPLSERDLVQFLPHHGGDDSRDSVVVAAAAPGTSDTASGQQPATDDTETAPVVTDQESSPDAGVTVLYAPGTKKSDSLADWIVDS